MMKKIMFLGILCTLLFLVACQPSDDTLAEDIQELTDEEYAQVVAPEDASALAGNAKASLGNAKVSAIRKSVKKSSVITTTCEETATEVILKTKRGSTVLRTSATPKTWCIDDKYLGTQGCAADGKSIAETRSAPRFCYQSCSANNPIARCVEDITACQNKLWNGKGSQLDVCYLPAFDFDNDCYMDSSVVQASTAQCGEQLSIINPTYDCDDKDPAKNEDCSVVVRGDDAGGVSTPTPQVRQDAPDGGGIILDCNNDAGGCDEPIQVVTTDTGTRFPTQGVRPSVTIPIPRGTQETEEDCCLDTAEFDVLVRQVNELLASYRARLTAAEEQCSEGPSYDRPSNCRDTEGGRLLAANCPLFEARPEYDKDGDCYYAAKPISACPSEFIQRQGAAVIDYCDDDPNRHTELSCGAADAIDQGTNGQVQRPVTSGFN